MMKMRSVLAIAAVGFTGLALQADTLRMRDGTLIPGTFEGADRYTVHFRPDGADSRTFQISDVDGVTFGGPARDRSTGANYDRDRGERGDRDRYANREQGQDRDQLRDRDRNQDQYANREQGPDADQNRDRVRNQYQNGDADRARYADSAPANSLVIPAGTTISVRMIDSIDSDVTHAGETYHATLAQPLMVNGQMIAPRGSDATVQVVRVRQAGRMEGREEVALALASIRANGRVIDLNTNNETVSSGSRAKQSGEVIGGGAALGAIIGAIAGGGEGAAIGAAGGAALGAGAQMVRGDRVRVRPETLLNFTLNHDVNL